jgi:hypothetical protein
MSRRRNEIGKGVLLTKSEGNGVIEGVSGIGNGSKVLVARSRDFSSSTKRNGMSWYSRGRCQRFEIQGVKIFCSESNASKTLGVWPFAV